MKKIVSLCLTIGLLACSKQPKIEV
ncbi:MAG: hypothetical protein RL662_1127, partial [Bacteroidota bacterium]